MVWWVEPVCLGRIRRSGQRNAPAATSRQRARQRAQAAAKDAHKEKQRPSHACQPHPFCHTSKPHNRGPASSHRDTMPIQPRCTLFRAQCPQPPSTLVSAASSQSHPRRQKQQETEQKLPPGPRSPLACQAEITRGAAPTAAQKEAEGATYQSRRRAGPTTPKCPDSRLRKKKRKGGKRKKNPLITVNLRWQIFFCLRLRWHVWLRRPTLGSTKIKNKQRYEKQGETK